MTKKQTSRIVRTLVIGLLLGLLLGWLFGTIWAEHQEEQTDPWTEVTEVRDHTEADIPPEKFERVLATFNSIIVGAELTAGKAILYFNLQEDLSLDPIILDIPDHPQSVRLGTLDEVYYPELERLREIYTEDLGYQDLYIVIFYDIDQSRGLWLQDGELHPYAMDMLQRVGHDNLMFLLR